MIVRHGYQDDFLLCLPMYADVCQSENHSGDNGDHSNHDDQSEIILVTMVTMIVRRCMPLHADCLQSEIILVTMMIKVNYYHVFLFFVLLVFMGVKDF